MLINVNWKQLSKANWNVTSEAFPAELEKTPRIYHIDVHDNFPFSEPWYEYNTYDRLRGELDFYFNKLPEVITEKRYTRMSSRYLKLIESNSSLYKILISGNVNTFEVFPRVLPERHAKLRLNRLALGDSDPL